MVSKLTANSTVLDVSESTCAPICRGISIVVALSPRSGSASINVIELTSSVVLAIYGSPVVSLIFFLKSVKLRLTSWTTLYSLLYLSLEIFVRIVLCRADECHDSSSLVWWFYQFVGTGRELVYKFVFFWIEWKENCCSTRIPSTVESTVLWIFRSNLCLSRVSLILNLPPSAFL